MADEKLDKTNFEDLPQGIRDWDSSLSATYLILEINKRLGVQEEKEDVISRLIYKLLVKEIKPENFINELSKELEINFQTAKSISEDIISKVLNPIDIDVNRIIYDSNS